MADVYYDPYLEDTSPKPAGFSPLSPNRGTDKEYREPVLEKSLPIMPSPPKASTTSLYPLSLVVLVVWFIFVILLLWLLETAVAHGPRSVQQPWAYTTLPGLLLTVFAQGHAGVTGMHLARVSVSALHSRRTSPQTWAEVFWISDRGWQGPVGIISTVLAALRLRVRTSMHFILCALTCTIALATPIVLSRAFPVRSITVTEDVMITPLALDSLQMGAIDGYSQVGMGLGSWPAGLPVTDIYNSSVFLPPGASRNVDPTDFFFAGSIENKTATLPGLRLGGQCALFEPETTVTDFTDFATYCDSKFPDLDTYFNTGVVIISGIVSVNLTMQACGNATWQNVFTYNQSTNANMGFFYFQSTNGSEIVANNTISVSGVVRCDSQISTGMAKLSGIDGTYTAFQEKILYNPTQGGENLVDPLFALMYYFSQGMASQYFTVDIFEAGVLRALGFVGVGDDGEESFTQPALTDMANSLWRGVSYTVAAIGLLSRTNSHQYPAVQSAQTAVYVREPGFSKLAYAFLAVWLFLLLLITARSYRPTFGSSFDSYLTTKLVMDNPNLLYRTSGDFSANENLRASFGRVATDGDGQVVVVEQ